MEDKVAEIFFSDPFYWVYTPMLGKFQLKTLEDALELVRRSRGKGRLDDPMPGDGATKLAEAVEATNKAVDSLRAAVEAQNTLNSKVADRLDTLSKRQDHMRGWLVRLENLISEARSPEMTEGEIDKLRRRIIPIDLGDRMLAFERKLAMRDRPKPKKRMKPLAKVARKTKAKARVKAKAKA